MARIRYFTKAELTALLAAAEPWFRAVIQAALFTGARWSELHQMKVRDVDLQSGNARFSETKGARPRQVHLTDEGTRFFARQVAGKGPAAAIFLNQHGRPLGPSHQIRPMLETCRNASVEPAGFHIFRHTYGSTLAMAGAPSAVIAEAPRTRSHPSVPEFRWQLPNRNGDRRLAPASPARVGHCYQSPAVARRIRVGIGSFRAKPHPG